MSLFSKKPKQQLAQRPLPVDRVLSMQRTGLSERDIIKQLKGEGYSFSEIEKAMLQSVKQGVGEGYPPMPEQSAMPPQQAPAQEYEPEPVQYPAQYTRQTRQAPAPVYEQPQEEELPEPFPTEPEPVAAPVQYSSSDHVSPEAIMEDLIESVVHEKFEQFLNQSKKLESDIDSLRTEMKIVKDKAEQKPTLEIPREWEDKLDDLEARIGGVERAFRQFLPSLSENIEALSRMIHEMKESRGHESRAPQQFSHDQRSQSQYDKSHQNHQHRDSHFEKGKMIA